MLNRKRPESSGNTPEADYEAGRAAMRDSDHQDLSGNSCPYSPTDRQLANHRTNWLTGYYDQFVDDSEIKARERMGLPLINWVPPSDEPKKKAKHHVRERN